MREHFVGPPDPEPHVEHGTESTAGHGCCPCGGRLLAALRASRWCGLAQCPVSQGQMAMARDIQEFGALVSAVGLTRVQ